MGITTPASSPSAMASGTVSTINTSARSASAFGWPVYSFYSESVRQTHLANDSADLMSSFYEQTQLLLLSFSYFYILGCVCATDHPG